MTEQVAKPELFGRYMDSKISRLCESGYAIVFSQETIQMKFQVIKNRFNAKLPSGVIKNIRVNSFNLQNKNLKEDSFPWADAYCVSPNLIVSSPVLKMFEYYYINPKIIENSFFDERGTQALNDIVVQNSEYLMSYNIEYLNEIDEWIALKNIYFFQYKDSILIGIKNMFFKQSIYSVFHREEFERLHYTLGKNMEIDREVVKNLKVFSSLEHISHVINMDATQNQTVQHRHIAKI